jgi:hypothetical protein
MTDQTNLNQRFLCNPEVVLREEDEDGGLLFNPDTNQVKIINTTGLFIWKQLIGGGTVPAIVDALQRSFEEVPQAEVLNDVQEFIQTMFRTGFVGEVEIE